MTDALPVLDPRPGGAAEQFAERLDGRHPALVFGLALVTGFVIAAVLSIGLGALVTDVLIHNGSIASADESFVTSLVGHRTSLLTSVSEVGSTVGSTVLVGIAALVAIIFAVKREWQIAAFVAFAPAVESGLYRVTSLADPRHRPQVARLEDLPVDASYPSGHTAASVALYGGLALLIASKAEDPLKRLLAWLAAILIVVFVAMSRLYRGRHHPLDVAGGLLVGVAALVVMLFVCRAAGAAAALRNRESG